MTEEHIDRSYTQHFIRHKTRLQESRDLMVIGGDMPVVCIDTGACNFSDLPLINITEIMSILLATVES